MTVSVFAAPIRSFRVLLFTALTAAGLFATACTKDTPAVPDYSAADEATIKKYLADQRITTAQRQPSGLYFLPVTTNASAPKIVAGATVSVLYIGHLLDATGTVFDASSRHGNVPLTFTAGQGLLLTGFEEGVGLMHIGDKAELLIPSALAYSTAGNGGTIPPNAVVRFEVEVVDLAVFDDNLIQKYLADKSITTAQKQASGLYFLPVTTNPTAVRPVTGSTVSVLYTGHLLDAAGTVFDATSRRGNAPFSFVLGRGQVIAGFDAGIALMHKGDKAELLIPSGMAYGPRGMPPTIGSNQILRFEVELVDVK